MVSRSVSFALFSTLIEFGFFAVQFHELKESIAMRESLLFEECEELLDCTFVNRLIPMVISKVIPMIIAVVDSFAIQ
jgi:hypothetical protein